MLDIAQFRKNFPEFNDTARYPDSMILFWSTIAFQQVNECRWKKMYLNGVQLYTAHEIVLASRNSATAINGGAPGTNGGLVNSKTVDGVTVSYDTTSTAEKNAGYYNLTVYGQQFYRFAMLFGAGSIQL